MTTWSRSPTRGATAAICTSATTSTRPTSGPRRSTRGCRSRSSSPRCSTLRTKAGRISRACRCGSRSDTLPGLFFLANYQLSENRDNGSGEVEANDTAFRTDFDADEEPVAVSPAPSRRVQLRLRAAVRRRPPLFEHRRSRGVRVRRLAGPRRGPRRQRVPVHPFGNQRLPMRLVRSAAGELRSGPRGATAVCSTTRRSTQWYDRTAYVCRQRDSRARLDATP